MLKFLQFSQYFLLFLATITGLVAKNEVKPNILWITGEDLSASWLGCYGNGKIKTPNFDKFAQQGFRYTHCFANVPVCAPMRSGWVTGIHPISTGTIYMRSLNATPESLIWYPDALRANGYFTANATKTDYNTSNRKIRGNGGGKNQGTCGHFLNTWDSYENACWNNPARSPDQPFFQINNSVGCHESFLHQKKNSQKNVDPADMKLAAYHPDIPEIRIDYARVTAGVMAADRELGEILSQLDQAGLAQDTIVIYSSDHGGIIGRSKRFLYDSGTHAPLIIRIPDKFKQLWPNHQVGTPVTRLVSFIDMPKTWLAITGATIPKEMQGRIFLGPKTELPAESVLSSRERMDEVPDMQRSIRDQRFRYIRNYEAYRPDGQYLQYLWNAPSMVAWEKYHQAGKTNEITGAFFRPKCVEMLFDCEADPDNVKNLASDPLHAPRLVKMREALAKQQMTLHDCGFMPEGMLVLLAKKAGKTIYDFIRDPNLYDQQRYMKAADLACFAAEKDVADLRRLIESKDVVEQYWGVTGCLNLGMKAATPEIITLLEKCLSSPVSDDATLDIRASAAYYLCQMDQKSSLALASLAEVIEKAKNQSPGKGRAWANLFLLGQKAQKLPHLLSGKTLTAADQNYLTILEARLKNTPE